MSAIDPGIEEPISNAAEDHHEGKENAIEDDYTTPGKWWFASTVCPLLAATFGPVANGFSICALVYTWRSYIPPGLPQASGKSINDPPWLLAVNALSLACALVGNAALLLNMAKRLRFKIAQPITIAGFFTAGVLLIADMAALSSSPTYFLTDPMEIQSHALTGAFYYAIWAAAIYIIIGFFMCVTVWGVHQNHFGSGFALTPAQRTLMLQTMMFIAYELLGALVFSTLEGWKYLDGVYWAQVTLLTIGLGDYSPSHPVSRGLLFPFAIMGILTVGLVVGSIRSLVLERGKEKIAARITEKRRESAVHNVDERKQTIKVSWFAQAEFSTDPSLTPAQRREEEFKIMRKVQRAAARERRYFALSMSLFFALVLWFVGAAIFMICERHEQGWTYFQSLYFTFVVLMTIGYGDFAPHSNAGKAFFVLWSLLAIPSLTILISNMGDTFVKWFSDLTTWVASFTVLPEKKPAKSLLGRLTDRANDAVSRFTAPGIFGQITQPQPMDARQHHNDMLDRLADRLVKHVEEEELEAARTADAAGDDLERDIHFYHYVLSRESRILQRDAHASPPKQYEWHEWEYFLKLMGDEEDSEDFEDTEVPDTLVPEPLQAPNSVLRLDGAVDRATEKKNAYAWHGPQAKKGQLHRRRTVDLLEEWSWLSEQSPLMSTKTEAEWILERLSAALVRELNRQRHGIKHQPPIRMRHALRRRNGNPDS